MSLPVSLSISVSLSMALRSQALQKVHRSTASAPSSKAAANAAAANVAVGSCGAMRTLDFEHSKAMHDLRNACQKTEDARMHLVVLKAERDELEARSTSLTHVDRDRLIHLCDIMCDLYSELSRLSKSADETEYLVETSDLLFKYYDQVDNGSAPMMQHEIKANSAGPSTRSKVVPGEGKISILEYFADTACALSPRSKMEDRAALMETYWSRINGDRMAHPMHISSCDGPSTNKHYVPPKAGSDACAHCGGTERTVVLQDGCSFCNACHTVEYIIVDHDRPSYKDPPKEVTFFAYKRINHFNEWLNQVQGKETTLIPEEVYDLILLEIKKRKMTNMADLTHKRLKDILKKLRANRYYEHIAFLINRLNGLPIPHLSNELEEKLRAMFCEIQVPFLRHKPSHRSNFLSYSYCLHKLCYLLGEDRYLEGFPLLRNRDKLFVQESIWKNICADLGWTFYKSM